MTSTVMLQAKQKLRVTNVLTPSVWVFNPEKSGFVSSCSCHTIPFRHLSWPFINRDMDAQYAFRPPLPPHHAGCAPGVMTHFRAFPIFRTSMARTYPLPPTPHWRGSSVLGCTGGPLWIDHTLPAAVSSRPALHTQGICMHRDNCAKWKK